MSPTLADGRWRISEEEFLPKGKEHWQQLKRLDF